MPRPPFPHPSRDAVIDKVNVAEMQNQFVSQAPPKDVSDQIYVWVAANIGDPFCTSELKAWADAVKDLGVKPTTITGPVTQDVPAQIAVVELAKQALKGKGKVGVTAISTALNIQQQPLRTAFQKLQAAIGSANISVSWVEFRSCDLMSRYMGCRRGPESAVEIKDYA